MARYRRTSLAGQVTNQPSVGSQFIPRPVAEVVPTTEGLEGLNQALSGFFSAFSRAGDNLREAELIKERQEIQQGNAQQEAKAKADALAGVEPDPALANDLDYRLTYEDIKGQKDGRQMARDFAQWYQDSFLVENPQGDLAAARTEWLGREFGRGTGSDQYNASALAAFSLSTEELINSHQENVVRAQIAQGKQNLLAVIAEDVRAGTITPDRIHQYIEQYRVMSPFEAHEAPLHVVNGILASVGDDPGSVQTVLSLLHQPGSGINGKSFFESFPEQAAAMEVELIQKYESGTSFQGLQAYEGLRELLSVAETYEDLEGAYEALDDTLNRYGQAGEYDAIRAELERKIEDFAAQHALMNRMDGYRTHSLPLDAGEAKSNMSGYLSAKGIDPFTMPVEAAAVIGQFGFMGDDLSTSLSTAITDYSNPERQAQAITFFQALSGQVGPEVADSMIQGEAASEIFRIINLRAGADPTRIGVQLEQLKSSQDARRRASEITWRELTESSGTETEAVNLVNDALTTSFNDELGRRGFFNLGWFKRDVDIDPAMLRDMADRVRERMVVTMGLGPAEYTAAVNEVVRRALENSDLVGVLPGFDGSLNLRYSNDRAPVRIETNEPVVPLSPNAHHPRTGEVINTTEIARQDMVRFADVFAVGDDATEPTLTMPEALTGSVGEQRVNGLSLAPGDARIERTGGWAIEDRDMRLVFGLGVEQIINGVRVTLPEDPVEAERILSEALGDSARHWDWLPNGDGEYTWLQPVYHPHWDMVSLEERESEFVAPPTEAPAETFMGAP